MVEAQNPDRTLALEGTLSRTKTLRWNPDIDWLVNDAPAELLERGSPPGPGDGGGRQPFDFEGALQRLKSAVPAVERARDLQIIARTLSVSDWGLLREYYQRRNACHVPGAIAAFSEGAVILQTHAGSAFAALYLAAMDDKGHELREALAAPSKSQSVPIISHYRRKLADSLDRVHERWALAAKSGKGVL